MFGEFLKALKSFVTLADDINRYNSDLKDVREELRDLTIIVHGLAQELKNSKERSEQRHEKLLLEIENRLLRYERALPAAPESSRKSAAKKRARKKGEE